MRLNQAAIRSNKPSLLYEMKIGFFWERNNVGQPRLLMKVKKWKRREVGQLMHKGKQFRKILPKHKWFRLKSEFIFSWSLDLSRISREASNFVLSPWLPVSLVRVGKQICMWISESLVLIRFRLSYKTSSQVMCSG